MTKSTLGSLALGLFVTACGPPDMNQQEVMDTLFPADKGVVGGYDFGDSWSDIKGKHSEVFKVRDDDFKQLRRAVSDNAGDNGYFIGFHLDGDGKVKSFDASISGSKQNAVTVRKILDDVIAHFDKTIGGGRCGRAPGGEGNSSNCDWSEQPGKPRVSLMYLEMNEPISGSIHIDIDPPEK